MLATTSFNTGNYSSFNFIKRHVKAFWLTKMVLVVLQENECTFVSNSGFNKEMKQ